MTDLTTTYMGLKLKNPIIIGSSGLTNSINKIKQLEENGAGAIVLKSLFEEQIKHEVDQSVAQNIDYPYPEALDYISNYTESNSIDKYLGLISEAKKSVNIPIIASVNCVSDKEWMKFAKKIEDAGADALELNVAILSSDESKSGSDNEQLYFNIVESIKKEIKIPVALKMSHYSAGLAQLIQKLSWTGNVDAMVLFNKYYSPDIDIDNFTITSANVFSNAEDINISLRWVAYMTGKIETDIAATTGIHDGKAVIKQLLAGAKAVQIASCIYNNGPQFISSMLSELEVWMQKHNFDSIEQFRGKMNLDNVKQPRAFERVQFMKHFSGIE